MFKKTVYDTFKDPKGEMVAFVDANPSCLNKESFTKHIPIIHAVHKNNYDALQSLIDLEIKHNDANVVKSHLGQAYAIVIHKIARFDDKDYEPLLDLLLEYKDHFDLDTVQKYEWTEGNRSFKWHYTPLMHAANFDRFNLCKKLVENGADINFCIDDGKTVRNFANGEGFIRFLNEWDSGQAQLQHTALPERISPAEINEDDDGFRLESPTEVSYSRIYEQAGVKLTTIFNFKYKTVTTCQPGTQGLCVKSFKDAASTEHIDDAARFLEQNDGQLCGYKPPRTSIA